MITGADVVQPAETFFGRRRWLAIASLILVMAAGLGLRLIDFTDPPLDVHAWRQLRSASIARGMYYDLLPDADPAVRSQAHYLGVTFQVLEPPILERLTAFAYLLTGGEKLWMARLFSTLFWMIGGLALFDLTRRMTSWDGGLAALAFYLFLPFANTHSRTFMPEPLLIMTLLLAAWAAYRWTDNRRWTWAVAAGVLAGLTILVKVFAVFPVVLGIGLMLLAGWGWRSTFRSPQTWVVAGLMAVIPSIYYLIILKGQAGNYLSTWTLPFMYMLADPAFYIRWLHDIHNLFNLAFVLLAAAGLALLPGRGRWMALGLWGGYALIGLSVPSLITSHTYYNLILTPFVAIGLAPLGALLGRQMRRQGWFWQVLAVGVLLVGLGDAALWARKQLTAEDFRQEPAFWSELAAALPNDGEIIALSEDYNTRMQYFGWRFLAQYPYSFDQDMVNLAGGDFDVTSGNWDYFLDKTEGYDYFLVTVLDEFDKQPYLKEILYGYYPVVAEGERYVLFDLRRPVRPLPMAGE